MTISDWSKVKRPIPVPDDLTEPFWEAAKKGVLELQHCQSCGRYNHPPELVCPICMSRDLKFEPVSSKGTIYSYSIKYQADQRFSPVIPYACLVVELDGTKGAVLVGNLLDAPYTEAKIGRQVEVVFEKLNDEITLPQFRLAKQ